MDLTVEEERGGFVVMRFVHEEVDDQWVNGVAFARLATLDEVIGGSTDIDNCCHLLDPKRLEFTVPAVDHALITKMPGWRDAMAANSAVQKTGKLTETMASFAVDAKTRPPKKVYFNIDKDDTDVKLSTKFFSTGKGETKVEHIKVPFKHEFELKGQKFVSMDILLVWRLCFEGTERPKGQGSTNTKKSAIDEICDLMSGL